MKLVKILGVVVALVLVLLVGASFALNAYFGSPKFRHLLLTETSRTLGTPVEATDFSFSLFDGAVLKGVSIASPKGFKNPNFFEARGFEFRYNLLALLGGKINITKVVLAEPTLILEQKSGGSSNLPGTAASSAPTAPTAPEGGKEGSLPTIAIDKLGLQSGSARVFKADGSCAVAVKGIDFNSALSLVGSQLAAKGDFSVEEIALTGLMKINHLRSPLETKGKTLQLTHIEGSTFGGKLDGTGALDFGKSATLPFTLNLKGSGIDLGALVKDLAGSTSPVGGTVAVQVQAVTPLTDTLNLNAQGHVEVTDCKLPSNAAFQIIGTLLNIPELTGGEFQLASSDFAIASQVVTLSKLTLNGPLVKLTGGGRIGFDQNYDLLLVLTLSPQALEKAPKELQGSFTKTNDGLFQTPPFRVYGTPGNMKTTLLEELLKGKAQGAVQKGLDGLLNKKKLF
jgi:hypothetical protein